MYRIKKSNNPVGLSSAILYVKLRGSKFAAELSTNLACRENLSAREGQSDNTPAGKCYFSWITKVFDITLNFNYSKPFYRPFYKIIEGRGVYKVTTIHKCTPVAPLCH